MKSPELTTKGTPRKNKPGAGAPTKGRAYRLTARISHQAAGIVKDLAEAEKISLGEAVEKIITERAK